MLKVKNMTNENVRRFIHLQEKANRMIDTYGQCSSDVADELEMLADMLSFDEIDAVCEYYTQIRSSQGHVEQLA